MSDSQAWVLDVWESLEPVDTAHATRLGPASPKLGDPRRVWSPSRKSRAMLRCVGVIARPRAADALRLAQRRFLAPERIDMGVLAEDLDINRVTLYRWFGSRDDFLVEAIWSLALRTFEYVKEKVTTQGAEGVGNALGSASAHGS
jgi:hypothetical protein